MDYSTPQWVEHCTVSGNKAAKNLTAASQKDPNETLDISHM